MAALWIVLLTAEGGGRAFNVIVHEDGREVAEATAVAAVLEDGWHDVRVMRSGSISDARIADAKVEFQEAASAAREFGWSMIRYRPTNLV